MFRSGNEIESNEAEVLGGSCFTGGILHIRKRTTVDVCDEGWLGTSSKFFTHTDGFRGYVTHPQPTHIKIKVMYH